MCKKGTFEKVELLLYYKESKHNLAARYSIKNTKDR